MDLQTGWYLCTEQEEVLDYVVNQSSSNKYLCLVPNILECFHHVTIKKMLVSVWSYLQCQHL